MLTTTLRFKPILKSVLWGGHRIAALKHLPDGGQPIGESWEISPMPGHESVVDGGCHDGLTLPELVKTYREQLVGNDVYKRYGNDFPLLIKIIDAHQNLSVQVHPDDEVAALRHHSPGKTEMWYVVDTAPQSLIMAGVNQQLTAERFDLLTSNGRIMECITAYNSKPGDVFFLPAGTIHSIGAGNLLVEIQQASDITYRLYDYDRRDANGNLRELHTSQARDVVNLSPTRDIATHCHARPQSLQQLVACRYFDVRHLSVDGVFALPWQPMQSFMVVVCTAGNIELITGDDCRTATSKGDTILIPACVKSITASGRGEAITASVD